MNQFIRYACRMCETVLYFVQSQLDMHEQNIIIRIPLNVI